MNEIRVGVIGLGFIGQTHLRAYESARQSGMPVRLVAVCDQDPQRVTGTSSATGNIGSANTNRLFDPNTIDTYTDSTQFFDSDSLDLVSICTHTDTHIRFAIDALAAGKHVLVEKPIAKSANQVQKLLDFAESPKANAKLCMPAMCMRFWPAWAWLKNTISNNTYGPVRSATFQRLGSTPNWADAFYKDDSSSGGALLDLHIHDTDFIHHCFGPPISVFSSGDENHLTTSYRFADSPIHITAEGCWDRAPASPYEMRFTVCFERATAVFDLNAVDQLVVHTNSDTQAIALSEHTGWDMQVRAFIQAILSKSESPPVSIRDAYEVMLTIEAERQSLREGLPVLRNI